jgi:oxaloacetate decarboxylase alpha subunit
MVAAGPCRQHYSAVASPVERLVGELARRPDVTHARIERDGFLLDLRANPTAATQGAAT